MNNRTYEEAQAEKIDDESVALWQRHHEQSAES